MYSFFTKIYQLFFSCFGFENCDTQSIENHSHKQSQGSYDVFSSKFSVMKKNAVSQKGKVYSQLKQKVHKLRDPSPPRLKSPKKRPHMRPPKISRIQPFPEINGTDFEVNTGFREQCGQNIMGPKHHLKAQKHQPKTPPKKLKKTPLFG